jgi:Fic family protein
VTQQFVPRGIVYLSEEEKKGLETRNGVIQARFVFHIIATWAEGQTVTPTLLLEFQRLAVNQIYRCAGHFRDGAVVVQGRGGDVVHQPPEHTEIPRLVQEMCDYVNDSGTKKPIHLAAYAMWRLNWIHPFFGGNGRAARAFSYLVLCNALKFVPPANANTIPQLIEENRAPYMNALRSADRAWAEGRLDLTGMEKLLGDLLAVQLLALFESATGEAQIPE